MTYNVFGGTLSLTQSINQFQACEGRGLTLNDFRVLQPAAYSTKISKPIAFFSRKKIILFQHVHIPHCVYWTFLITETHFSRLYSNFELFCTKATH